MPELRQDPTTKEWVIIARERAKRPDQFRESQERVSVEKAHKSVCPFCPGNEQLTPDEVFALRNSGGKGQFGWHLRVVPNKFAALTSGGVALSPGPEALFHRADGYGHHEVIIESPDHSQILPLMSEQQYLEILYTYRQRYNVLSKDPRVKLVLLFRNHGKRAGTSLEHPHSQLVATPVIPLHIRQKYEVAIRHYDDTGHCLYCDLIREEHTARVRVVMESAYFLIVHPFASQVPFETWILPKEHNPCFARISSEQMVELASVLRRILRGLHDALGNPDFNLIVHTAPIEDEAKPYFLWHIEIRPRMTTQAGFELGTGIYINTAVPEETAQFMKSFVLNAHAAG